MIIPQDQGKPLPKFGEWDVNDPASAEGYTVIFNKARDEKKTGAKPESPARANPQARPPLQNAKTQSVRPLDSTCLYFAFIIYIFCVYICVCFCVPVCFFVCLIMNFSKELRNIGIKV